MSFTSTIDITKPETGTATTQSVRDNFVAAKAEIEALANDPIVNDSLRILSDDAGSAAGPILTLDRNSASPDDDDLIGQIDFRGRDTSANDLVFARIHTQIVDAVTGSADSKVVISTMLGSSLIEAVSINEFGEMTVRSDITTTNGHIEIGSTTGGEDLRFADSGVLKARVTHFDGVLTYQSDPSNTETNSAHIFQVDGSEVIRLDAGGNVGIGEVSPADTLHITSAFPIIRLEDSDNNGYGRVRASNGNLILEADQGNSTAGSSMTFNVDAVERVRIDNTGRVRIGGSSGPLWVSGSGSPESIVAAPVGSFFSRTDGGAGTSFYVKESGSGNTGWVGK